MKQEAKTLSVPVAGRLYFDLGKNASYEAAKRGEIPVIKIGSRLRVPIIALEKMLEQAGSPIAPSDAGLPPTVSGPREDGTCRKPNHPLPLSRRKGTPIESGRYRARNKNAEKSSARRDAKENAA